jgi:hypothetical protein
VENNNTWEKCGKNSVRKITREKCGKYLEKNVKKIHRKNGEKMRKQRVGKM